VWKSVKYDSKARDCTIIFLEQFVYVCKSLVHNNPYMLKVKQKCNVVFHLWLKLASTFSQHNAYRDVCLGRRAHQCKCIKKVNDKSIAVSEHAEQRVVNTLDTMFFRTEVGAQVLKQVVKIVSRTDHRLHAKPMGKEVLGRIKSTKLSKLGKVIYLIFRSFSCKIR